MNGPSANMERAPAGKETVSPQPDRLAGLLTSAGDGIMAFDLEGRCMDADANSRRLLGLDRDALEGSPGEDLFPPAEVALGYPAFRQIFDQALAGDHGYPYFTSHLPQLPEALEGRWLRGYVYRANEGVTVLLRDRTSRLRDLLALRESQEQFQALVEGLADPIRVSGEGGTILYVNPAYVSLFGRDPVGEDLNDYRARWVAPEDLAAGKWQPNEEAVRRFEYTQMATDGRRVMVETNRVRVRFRGEQATLAVLRDVTERKRLEQQLAHQALHDELTGLPNRSALLDRLGQELRAGRGEACLAPTVGLLVIDLNGFKEVNDCFGHAVGDRVLQEVARRFQGPLRDGDTVARLGGDEFAVVLPGLESVSDTGRAASRLLETLTEPIVIDEVQVHVGASIGMAAGPRHGHDAGELLRVADSAMYQAKRAHSGFALYSGETSQTDATQIQVARELRDGIRNRELRLHYQPVVDPYTGQVDHLEALVRWQHPALGLLPPSLFIPLAERTGLVRSLTAWVLDEALANVVAWREQGLGATVAVNIAVQHLQDADLTDQIGAALGRWQVPAAQLRLEVTEQGLITNLPRVRAAAFALRDIGVILSIDDFGTGQAAFGYLRDFGASELKIDRSFIAPAAENPMDAALVRSIIDIAGALEMRVVAEGVEDRATLDLLMTAGCDLIQGYYYSRPVPAAEVIELVRRIEAGVAAPAGAGVSR